MSQSQRKRKMNLKERAASLLSLGALTPLYTLAGGLSEFYALIFSVSGIILAFRGKLDGNFAAMIVAIQGLLVAHDAIDGFLEHKRHELDNARNSVPSN
jgi:hypothetical protein